MIWSTEDLCALEDIRVGPAEVVYAFLSLEREPSTFDEALLDEEEWGRSRRFVRSHDRRRFVLAHAGLRLFLARCLDVEPATVRYVVGVHGKPRLAPRLTPLEFNMSHSERLGLLAVARDRAVGVDIERVRDLPDALSIADTHFSAGERQALRSLPLNDQSAAFFRCWTRKEAMIKAGGEGLGHALDSFEVDLAPSATSALRRYGGRSGDEVGSSVRALPSPPGYSAAGCVAAPSSASMPWRELSGKGAAG